MTVTISRHSAKLAGFLKVPIYLNKKPVAEIANHQTIELTLADSQADLALNVLNLPRMNIGDGDHILIKTIPYWLASYILAILALITLFLSLIGSDNPIRPYAQLISSCIFLLSCLIPRHRLLKQSS